MLSGVAKILITILLTIYMVSGGTVCIHKFVSLFDCGAHNHCHHHPEDAHFGDHDSEPTEEPCDCELKAFKGSLPVVIHLAGLEETFDLTELILTVETVQSLISYQSSGWKHPPPLAAQISLPILQRFNV
ncbi:MAG: hypothetical protein P1U89_13100 [Verrucomicrobiales bacterium]|nr:hypothetical protein [Verrucomicrobiales bacterium]